MNITVIFADGSVGTIDAQNLDQQIEIKAIKGFYRASGWAVLNRDKLRSNRDDDTHSWRDRKCNRLLLTSDYVIT
jgi:hypothetical protein